ncbi:MAG TPA: hypothetical protein VFV33_27060 [Gemmatimonadaceae bacterium]|nr:hypothetical protein [Gemmatimonadaceae bacterium]
MHSTRRPGESAVAASLLAGALLTLGACERADSLVAPADAQRTVGALQLQSTAALPVALNSRTQSGDVTWTPAIPAAELHRLVPAQVIQVPETVRAGASVAIVINTIGENGCWEADGGSLTQRGDTAFVVAFDRHSGAPVCTQLWTDRLAHQVTTVFPTPGVGVIRVQGRRIKGGDPSYSLPVTAERRILVLP